MMEAAIESPEFDNVRFAVLTIWASDEDWRGWTLHGIRMVMNDGDAREEIRFLSGLASYIHYCK